MNRCETMTGRERWAAAIRREKPDRLPMDYRGTDECTKMLLKHAGVSDFDAFCARYHIENWHYIGPEYIGPKLAQDRDEFGCRYQDVDYGTGAYRECVYHPLAQYDTVEQIEREYTWPSADAYDYSRIAAQAQKNKDKPLMAGGWEPYLFYKYLRGEEQGYMDMILYPEICHYIMGKLIDLFYTKTQRTLDEADGLVLISDCSEDLGSQTGLLYSPKHIREYFLPYHKRMIDLQHAYGAYVVWHSDGAVREILPELIDLGIDLLDPVQWRCTGMDRAGLKRDFGGSIAFHGAVDNQWTLPFGSVRDVEREVLENFEILGGNGGYILGPCHNCQSVGPPENIIAMYETCYAQCWY